jgi:hypothetical protein
MSDAVRGWITFAVLAAIMVALYAVYARGHSNGSAEVQARWDKAVATDKAKALADERRAQGIVDQVGQRVADEVSKIRVEHTTITRTIRNEIKTVPVYSECILTDRVFNGLNQLRAATDTGAKPDVK